MWTFERIEELCALWAEGMSASEIGTRLGVTKNAVIGKVHRLKLSKRREAYITHDPVSRRVYVPRKAKPLIKYLPACRYIARGESAFCDKPTERGAFCAEHAALCYRSPNRTEKEEARRAQSWR